MKVTLESTPETAHANGLPVRIWSGTTERGSPVLALITRLAVPDDAHPDDLAQVERELTEPPTRERDAGGRTRIALPRFCRMCESRGMRRAATHVARAASGFEWFECIDHSSTDNPTSTERVARESLGQWFDRVEEQARRGLASRGVIEPPAVEPSWLVKDFWVLYSAARQLNEALTTAVGEAVDETSGGPAVRGDLIAHAHQGLGMQLQRLAPAFDFCEAERRGEPPPVSEAERDVAAWQAGLIMPPPTPSAAELVARAKAIVPLPDLLGMRFTAAGWLGLDELTMICPSPFARGLLAAFDALAQLHGPEAMQRSAELDEFVTRGEVPDLGARPWITDAHAEALAALHKWLHQGPWSDCNLIEAAQRFHDLVERETPAECTRFEAEYQNELRAAGGERLAAATCRVCGCTDLDCSACIAKTGAPCRWIERDLCSACSPPATFPDTRPKDITGEPIAGDPPSRNGGAS
jgi:hypothetical protein